MTLVPRVLNRLQNQRMDGPATSTQLQTYSTKDSQAPPQTPWTGHLHVSPASLPQVQDPELGNRDLIWLSLSSGQAPSPGPVLRGGGPCFSK